MDARFTTPVTCREGSVHDAIDNAFHNVGAPNPDAFCTVVNRGDTSGAEKAVAGFAGVVEGIAHIIPPTKE